MSSELQQAADLEHAGKLGEARDLVLTLAGKARNDAEAAQLLARASELALYAEGPERGGALARQACDRARAAGDAAATAAANLALARVHLRVHTDAALDDADAALDQADGGIAGLPAWLQATSLKLRGLVTARRGRPREALELFAAAYQRAEGYPEVRARVLLTWALQLRNWGIFEEAARLAERSLEIRLELNDTYGAALCHGVIAFIHQRRGDSEAERDALVADLRAVEKMGGVADAPALQGRLAGALVGLGKYAGAWAAAEESIRLEELRLGMAGATATNAGRTHAYAWREMARVCLAQNRVAEGLELAARGRAVFERLRDGYGGALCRLTEAELHLAEVRAGDATADVRLRAALQAAKPVFVRLGAVPEAVEIMLLDAELEALQGRSEIAARRTVDQVLPMLQQSGLGSTRLFRRAVELVERMHPSAALDRVVTQAATLRSLAAIAVETDAQPGTAVAARLPDEPSARRFARAAIDQGAVVLWPGSDVGLAVLLGDGHAARAAALATALAGLPCASAAGEIDLEHMWPAGVRARGAPVEAALAALAAG
jgi:hypothetical protein